MKYKDLIYKITSQNATDTRKSEDMKKDSPHVNPAKKSVQIKDILIGIIVDEKTELSKDMLLSLKRAIERTLTVLFNSPISETFSFLPYSKKALDIIVDTFPDMNIHFVSNREEYKTVKELKKEKMNIKMIYPTLKKNEDFVKKIDYLVTINHTLEPTMEAALKANNVMVFPMDFIGITSTPQKEKLVTPDPSGWIYNPASGMWVKNWGWDGSQSIPGW